MKLTIGDWLLFNFTHQQQQMGFIGYVAEAYPILSEKKN